MAVLPQINATRASAEEKATPNIGTRLAAQAYPGIQLIQTKYQATLSVPIPDVSRTGQTLALADYKVQVLTGKAKLSEQAIFDILLRSTISNPNGMLIPSAKRLTRDITKTGIGSGWVATPEGHIVTAAHVVDAKPDTFKREVAKEVMSYFGDRNSLAVFADKDLPKSSLSSAELAKLGTAITTWQEKYLTVDDLEVNVSVQTGESAADLKDSPTGQTAEVLRVGEAYPGKDVAILKISGESQRPTLPLGSDADVSVGSTLHVVGYPAASTFSAGISEDAAVEPTVTEGPLTAIKDTTDGTKVFQTQAPASPGNSGGPVLDDSGKVIGILVASAVDGNAVALENQGFIIPASVISEMLTAESITPQVSQVTRIYNEGLVAYFKRWYKPALEKFAQIARIYPNHPYVGEFKNSAEAKIKAGEDETPWPMWVWLLIAGVVGFFLLLAGLGIWLLRRRNRRKSEPTPPAWVDPYRSAAPGYPPQSPQPHHPAPGNYPAPPAQPPTAPLPPGASPGAGSANSPPAPPASPPPAPPASPPPPAPVTAQHPTVVLPPPASPPLAPPPPQIPQGTAVAAADSTTPNPYLPLAPGAADPGTPKPSEAAQSAETKAAGPAPWASPDGAP